MPLRIVRLTEQIIDAHIIQSRELDQYRCGNVVFARLVFGIPRLRHPDFLGQLLLTQIVIFSEVSQPAIHVNSPQQEAYSNLKQSIDK